MTQTRLYLTAPKSEALALYGKLERVFEDDGLPLAMIEVDEAKGLVELSVYSEDADADERRIRGAFASDETHDIGREKLPDIDWVAKSLEGLKPVRSGRFLVHGSHDRASRRIGDFAIEIDAGQAFGTGHHGTTAGCLTMIGEVMRRERPRNVLDLGTGSAVLAIAAAKLAPVRVLATDIDPVATVVARENVRINGVASRVALHTAVGFGHREIARRRPYDLIVANVLAGPLMRLAPDMARHVRPGGSIILSGILAHQRRAVLAAYANQHCRHVKTLWRDEWVTLHLKR